MLGKYWVPTRENLVTRIENEMILSSLSSGYDVVVDATNLRGTQRFEKLTDLYSELKIEVEDFTDISFETCIERDSLRKGDERVGEEVIMRMYNKYIKK
jgi:predicted kinase